MKAFQPTIIDLAETPKPLVTHTAVKVSNTREREGGRRERSAMQSEV